jgi:dipeptidyl aminopeptidase/acylaminoacyl peptidase
MVNQQYKSSSWWLLRCAGFLVLIFIGHLVWAEDSYQQPPKEILDILAAPPLPIAITSPAGNAMIFAFPQKYLPISDLAEPQLRLAGVRINPKNNALFMYYFVKYLIKRLPDGAETPLELPNGVRGGRPLWNADGSMFAFTNMTETSVELWIGELQTGKVHRVDGISLNPVLGDTIGWMPDHKTLLIKTVPVDRSAPPAETTVPSGPRVEDSQNVAAASSTYESRDLLNTPHDADLFQYYATSQLELLDVSTNSVKTVGTPDVFSTVDAAPGGQYLLLERIQRPYSFIRTYDRFPTEIEVWDTAGKKIETLASVPVADQVPIHGVRTGPREHSWRPTAPATIMWVEALDGGDTYKKVPHHDRIMLKTIGGSPVELFQTEQRFDDFDWIDQSGLVLLTEYDDDKHWTKTFLVDADNRAVAPRLVWSLNSDDNYHNPGYPIYRSLTNGARAVREFKGTIFLRGEGSSPEGNRPFVDRINLKTLKTERLFRSSHDSLEWFLDWVDPSAMTFLLERQSPSEPPNVFLGTIDAKVARSEPGEAAFRSTTRQLTHFFDPTPQLRQISKRLVTYSRPDGVKLSFTLYLPPGYKEGTRLPTIMWAYPLDYTDPSAAGQVSAAPNEFTQIWGASPIFMALEGYAVLDETAMPVVGPTETAYDTFIEQLIANAKAAIDKAVELGVTDPERVGVSGHSHGALMTVTLLTWSDLFRAGIARSGAYNHTLRPFGFQNERRTLYQAPNTYLKLSPLLHADKIKDPLLLIHGERDANPGTVPLQSEKLFEAIRGVGGTARLVVLPLESHGYAALESVEDVLYEMVTWFDRYVKNAPPRK